MNTFIIRELRQEMELYSADAKSLEVLIKDWLGHPETELEATFGEKGQVDATTFLTIAARMKAKGFVATPQLDRLSIILPDQVRFQLNGFGIIQQYCRDERIGGKKFEAMIKDRTSANANLDLKEYNVRIKSRREVPLDSEDPKVKELITTWFQQKKAFRLIRRWSFKGHGIVFDLSMVRSSPTNTRGEYRWVRRFADFDIMNSPPKYEIEAELLRDPVNATAQSATKTLIAGLTNVLRGIQKNVLLIRKSVKESVLESYAELVKTDRFRGVAPVTLETKSMMSVQDEQTPNIRNGYNVTEKADGLRVHAFCDSRGELFMIDMGMNVYRTGLQNADCKNSLLDGEFVTRDKENNAIQQLLLFDVYIAPNGEDVTRQPFFEGRHKKLELWIDAWKGEGGPKIIATGLTLKTQLQVAIKKFVFATPGNDSIFRAAAQVLDTSYIYYVDGLIFTSNTDPIPQKPGVGFMSQFKWKPSEDNTIDFLVISEKEKTNDKEERVQTGIHPDTGETIRYKTLRLFVGSSKEAALDDPRTALLFEQPIIGQERGGPREYKPVLFNPKENPDTMASVCHIISEVDPDSGEEYIRSERSGEPIRDRSIVEMAYDPARSPGWRWYPIRVRTDKTERLQKGTLARTLNSEEVGESVWNSIHDPVTLSMIRTGSEEPTQDEISSLLKAIGDRVEIGKKYYTRKAPEKDLLRVRGLRDFHNRWIKDTILYEPVLKPGDKTILDLAVGKAGDLQRWRRGKVAFVLGVDYAGENIRDPGDGAYRRLLDTIRTSNKGTGTASMAPMFFAIGDSSKNLSTGEAGANSEERDILRSIIGKVKPEGPLPPLIEKSGAGRLRMGADVMSCMFAIHYFFQNAEIFSGFLRNVQENLKIGGYFIGCAFDGERVFELLRGIPEGQSRIGTEDNTTLWKITKSYSAEEIPLHDEGFGLPVDVEFISIGSSHREYLVPFNLLVEKFKSIGLELLKPEQMREIGLSHSSALFDESYKMSVKAGKKFAMGEAVKQFSFMNRWFIFKRTSDGTVTATEATTETVAPPAAATEEEGAAVVPGKQMKVALLTRKYGANEVINFYTDAGTQDKLAIKDPLYARYLAPSAYFSIPDKDDPTVIYPSLEHFIAGMKYKIGGNNPIKAKSLFSTDGIIYSKYDNKRLEETGAGQKKLSWDREAELLKDETTDIRKETTPTGFKRHKTVFDEVKWASQQDGLLRYALTYRYDKDARYRKIIEAARNQKKYLLYYSQSGATSELGGRRRADDERIEGQNKLGLLMMKIAVFPGV